MLVDSERNAGEGGGGVSGGGGTAKVEAQNGEGGGGWSKRALGQAVKDKGRRPAGEEHRQRLRVGKQGRRERGNFEGWRWGQ